MRKLVVGCAIVVCALFAGAQLVQADSNPKAEAPTGPPIPKRIEKVRRMQAAKVTPAIQEAKKKRSKVKLFYYQATTPTFVAPFGVTDIHSLTCPSGQLAASAFYNTDRLITADVLTAVSATTFAYGFDDLSGEPGQAVEGIVCAKGVK